MAPRGQDECRAGHLQKVTACLLWKQSLSFGHRNHAQGIHSNILLATQLVSLPVTGLPSTTMLGMEAKHGMKNPKILASYYLRFSSLGLRQCYTALKLIPFLLSLPGDLPLPTFPVADKIKLVCNLYLLQPP